MRLIILLLTYLLSLSLIHAAVSVESEPAQNPYHLRHSVIGVSASSIAGMGLSYKYAFNDFFHWRIAGIALPSRSSGQANTYSNIGTDIQFNIFNAVVSKNVFFRSYIAPAISYWQQTGSFYINYSEIHTGATLGVEMVIVERVSIHGEFGFVFYYYTNSGYYSSNNDYNTNLAGGIGIGLLF